MFFFALPAMRRKSASKIENFVLCWRVTRLQRLYQCDVYTRGITLLRGRLPYTLALCTRVARAHPVTLTGCGGVEQVLKMAREVQTEKMVSALAESVKPRLSGPQSSLDAFQVSFGVL